MRIERISQRQDDIQTKEEVEGQREELCESQDVEVGLLEDIDGFNRRHGLESGRDEELV
jgi:hypothetical protein